jgi:hypothetical protein
MTDGGERPVDAGAEEAHTAMRHRGRSIAWAAGALLDYDMPADEIGAVIAADGPEVVHRYLELHRERLEERLEEQRRGLASVERFLAAAIERRRRASVSA